MKCDDSGLTLGFVKNTIKLKEIHASLHKAGHNLHTETLKELIIYLNSEINSPKESNQNHCCSMVSMATVDYF